MMSLTIGADLKQVAQQSENKTDPITEEEFPQEVVEKVKVGIGAFLD